MYQGIYVVFSDVRRLARSYVQVSRTGYDQSPGPRSTPHLLSQMDDEYRETCPVDIGLARQGYDMILNKVAGATARSPNEE